MPVFTTFFEFVLGIGGPVVGGLVLALVGVFCFYFYALLRPAKEYEGDSEAAIQLRADYAARRENLAGRKNVASWYDTLLGSALNRVDRLFGDEPGRKERPLAYWSAPALDRCLLLALIYPAATLLIVWHITGQTGALEQTLQFNPDATGFERTLSGLSLLGLVVLYSWVFSGTKGRAGFIIGVIRVAVLAFGLAVVFAIAFAFAGAGAGLIAASFAFAAAVAFAFGSAGVGEGAGIGAGVLAFAVAVWLAGAGPVSVGAALALAFAFAGALMQRRAIWRWGALAALCLWMLLGSYWILGLEYTNPEGLLLLAFFGILPVINALFDWLSLGVTRFLLRRGQAKGAWASLRYAALDLLLAFGVLIALTTVCVAVLTGLNARAGEAVFDVAALLNQLDDPETRFAPNTWWVYVTIFTTLLPSLCNVALGLLAAGRAGMAGLNRWVVDHVLPENPAALTFPRRVQASGALTAQWAVAGLAATAVMAVLAGVFFYLIQLALGPSLLEMAWWAHNLVIAAPLTAS